MTVVAAVVVVRAAAHFNQTYDEGAHLAAGMEWLTAGQYRYDVQHPPLARVAIALGPKLFAGARSYGRATMWDEGNAILVGGGRYARTLMLARLGVLPFFVLLLAVVWAWTRELYDERAAALAVLLVATLPQILAHAGLATNDLPLTAALVWVLYAFTRWIARPTAGRTAMFAVAGGVAVATKLSSLPFFAIAALLIVAAWWIVGEHGGAARAERIAEQDIERSTNDDAHDDANDDANDDAPIGRGSWAAVRAHGKPALAAALGAALVVWAAYRFHVAIARGFVPVPAPELLRGIRQLAGHDREGHPAFLLGHVRQHGWWYYSLVALAVKAPLAFLSLAALGVAHTLGERRRLDWRRLAPMLGALAVILVAMLAAIDIGVRHVLVVYPLLAIPAAGAAGALWRGAARRAATRVVLAALVLWQVAATVHAYPDFLADFNVLAGRHPERVLSDSNLDWGQDLWALGDTLEQRHVTSVTMFYFGTTPVGAVRLADTVRLGGGATTGWIAASRTYLAGAYVDCLGWLSTRTPVARIGRSMLLYHILPDSTARPPADAKPIASATEPYGAVLGTPERHGSICHDPRMLLSAGPSAVAGDPAGISDDRRHAPNGAAIAAAAAATRRAEVVGEGPSDSALAARPSVPVTAQTLLDAANTANDWPVYGRDYSNRRYSPLDQITTGNVRHLSLAWVHQLGTQPAAEETSPIEIGGTIFYTGPFGVLVAVDAVSGAELWRYQYKLGPVPSCCGVVNRGVAVYHDKVYISTLDDHLLALDRRTGAVIWDVQVTDPTPGYSMTSAPLAVDGKIVVGVSGSEFAVRGFVDAYDAETGARVWRFWTIPSPEQGGWWGKWSPTTPDGDPLPRDIAREKRDSARYADAWRTGGGGVWNTPSYDPALGMIYFGVGNPAPNMDGSMRPGDNLYTVSIVGVDVHTGRLRWYYQEVPHDEWDYDATSPTVLFDVMVNGQRVPAVAEAGKVGWVYILDRRTGARIRRTTEFVPHENTFAAPTTAGVRIMPGMGGGSNSAPPSFSPRTGLLYVSGIVEPILFVLSPEKMQTGVKWQGGHHVPLAAASGTFTAIDVATGKIRWQTHTAERMLGSGSVVTAGDVVFYGEQQGVFNAADARTGKVLWSVRTGGPLRAPPITYAVDGKQYVAIAAGMSLFAFTLEK